MTKIKDDFKNGIHWVEKYRPNTLDELVSHKDIINTIEKFINEDHMPHLLFSGPPGTGKTSTILACARKLYQDKMNTMVLELNASDDRGIGIVRGPIQAFASTKIFDSNFKFKLIILDEADAMTNDAQNALRRIIEKYTSNVRFCFICNYITKIIPAIQSRCTKFRFAPLKFDQIKTRLEYIAQQESVQITEDGKNVLIELSQGDMRKVLNVLQSTWTAFQLVNEENVYKCCGLPTNNEIQTILQWLLNEQFSKIYQNIKKIQHENGYSIVDIINRLHDQWLKFDIPKYIKMDILEQLAQLEVNLCSGGGSEKVQMAALISAFQIARNYNNKL